MHASSRTKPRRRGDRGLAAPLRRRAGESGLLAVAEEVDDAQPGGIFTFALSGPLPPKEMGTILGVAVLLNAFLVRLLLLPVFLRLSGRAAWWLPGWLDRVLPDVRFGHGQAQSPIEVPAGLEPVGVAKVR